jgi:hypothetical protein
MKNYSTVFVVEKRSIRSDSILNYWIFNFEGVANNFKNAIEESKQDGIKYHIVLRRIL